MFLCNGTKMLPYMKEMLDTNDLYFEWRQHVLDIFKEVTSLIYLNKVKGQKEIGRIFHAF